LESINKDDFVVLQYTGKIAEENVIFDTTNEIIAKKTGLYRPGLPYGGIIVCVGQSQVVAGLDEALAGKELDKEYTLNVPAEKAFGRKLPKLIQLIAASKFLKDKIQPIPGLQVNVDGNVGIIKTVNGGRILVDFNHPLSGKEITYQFTIKRKVHDAAEKITAMLALMLQVFDARVVVQDKTAVVRMSQQLPQELIIELVKHIKKLVKDVDEIRFEAILQQSKQNKEMDEHHHNHQHEHNGESHNHNHNHDDKHNHEHE